ncbi:MAG: hypothetical protein Q8W45_06330, partial [Candidatus Palauibacterales bacterium]|nr:hypothetical protein [Candidatus Palauibacterales bacterium]
LIAGSPQTPALGAAIAAAVVAGPEAGGYDGFESAQARMTSLKEKRFLPDPAARAVYDELYALYRELHDGFGGRTGETGTNEGTFMKRLLGLRDRVASSGASA